MNLQRLFLFAFYGLALLFASSIHAQQKRVLTPKDYKLWSELGASGMSDSGAWVYYTVHHAASDTVYLHHSKKGLQFFYPRAHSASFSPHSKWFGFMEKDSLMLQELSTSKRYFVSKHINAYHFSDDGKFLIADVKTAASKSLRIVDLKTFATKVITDVVEFQLNPTKTGVGIITNREGKQTVSVFDFNGMGKERNIVIDAAGSFQGLQWDGSGKKLGFFKQSTAAGSYYINPIIYWCSRLGDEFVIKTLKADSNLSFPKDSYIPFSRLYVSEQTNQVFFDRKRLPDAIADKKDAVQIWLAEDLTLPPIDVDKTMTYPKWTVWDTDMDTVLAVEDDEHGNVVLSGDDKNAMLYSTTELTPFYKYGGDFIAIYLKNLKTGKKDLISPKQSQIENQTVVSPGGKYIAYFKDKHWWVYDIALQKHTCLTVGMPLSLNRLDYDRPDLIPPYGSPGWTENDKEILIYDQYDIWIMKPDGSSRKRLTNGEKTGTVYRLWEKRLPPSPRDSFFGFRTQVYNVDKSIVLKTQNSATLAEGFAIRNVNGTIKPLFEKASIVNLIAQSKDGTAFLFIESNFELPQRLFTLNAEGKEKLVKQYNPQQKDFYWGKSGLIHYTNAKGEKLRGALFYPANYDSKKKYPMIVCIYERKSKEVFDYVMPSLYSNWGFNVTNFTTDGYFVLFPDIAYGINTTGNDALECVTAAISAAVKDNAIDQSNIALVGHSFGGYETAYIMGHSMLFKTAVVGAPMIDLVSSYLTLDGHGMSNMWRYEFDQFRIQAPFDSDTFDDNSPLKSARNITAPLLLWTGTADLQLDWKHSMKLQSALWRMGKKSTMLVYPEEGHVLMQDVNQLDLTVRVKDWLDYYLKGKPIQQWMGKQ